MTSGAGAVRGLKGSGDGGGASDDAVTDGEAAGEQARDADGG